MLPIALLAIRLGFRGGLAGGLLALGAPRDLGFPRQRHGAYRERHVVRGIAFLMLGTLLGIFVDELRRFGSRSLALRDFAPITTRRSTC